MAAYAVANYKVTNPEAFEGYPEAAIPTIFAAGGEVLAADMESEPAEGSPHHVTVILKFDSKDAIKAWYASPEYEAVKAQRIDNTEGNIMLAEGFVPPSE